IRGCTSAGGRGGSGGRSKLTIHAPREPDGKRRCLGSRTPPVGNPVAPSHPERRCSSGLQTPPQVRNRISGGTQPPPRKSCGCSVAPSSESVVAVPGEPTSGINWDLGENWLHRQRARPRSEERRVGKECRSR